MITLSFWQLALIIIPLILIEGFYAGSEIAILAADKLFLKNQAKQGNNGALLALEMANHPERVLSTTLFVNNLCVISISALIALYFLENSSTHSELWAILTTSPLIVILGELIPKTAYQKNANKLAPWVSYPLFWTYLVCYPVTKILASYTTQLARIIAPIEELLAGKKRNTREEIQALLSYTRKETEIKSSEKKIIRRIFDFRDSEAQHALIPLVRVDALENTSTVQEALASFEKHRHSRMPVYSERIDNIIGVIEAVNLLSAGDLKQSIRNFVSPIHYVSETQSLEDLLLEMRREDTEMVVVVDEHGGAVGILTFEDIIEEIVGEISDEFDYESLPFKVISENQWVIQAQMEIEQINETLNLALPEGNYETLSGFLLQQFGRIPKVRDELYFNTLSGSYRFLIQKASARHIETVLIEKMDSS